MKSIKFFVIGFFTILLLVLILFAGMVNFCGRGVTDQPWFLDLYPLKAHFAKEKKNPKIILIGGSCSLLGINGKQLAEYTGMDNINLSMSVMVPMRFYLVDLEKYVKEGDIVVLPLEVTNHYCETEEKIFSNFGISLLFGGMPDAQKTLSGKELCSLYFQYGFSWINTSLFHKDGPLMRLFTGDRRKQGIFDSVCREQYVYEKWASLQTEDKKGTAGYFSDLSIHGDWMIDQKTGSTEIKPYAFSQEFSREFLSDYSRIKKMVNQKKASLLLVWPNLYFYPEQTGFLEFKQLLATKGITIYGRPEAMAFPKEFYHDPINHMNCHGAELWTRELAKTICQVTGRPLKKINPAWHYVVFADDPVRYFPNAERALYDTGVRLKQKEFSMVLNIPDNMRGKNLALNLIAIPDRRTVPVFSGIRVNGKTCKVEERLHQERMEADIHVPAVCTLNETITLTCSINGETIGMERLFMEEGAVIFYTKNDAPVFSFTKGFSIQEEWGRWTDGPYAEFSVYLPGQFRKKELSVVMDVQTFVHTKKPVCRFQVLAEDGKVLLQAESTQFLNSFKFKVPPKYTGKGQLKFLIKIDDVRSGKQLGISEDPRKLGVGLRSIRMEAE